MNLTPTKLAGAWVLENVPIQDNRGAFTRLFCVRELESILGAKQIVQINHSMTRSVGAVRGLHYQHPPNAEIKIVRCVKGRVFDVAVDLRQGSPTFLEWTAVELSPANNRAFVIPEGCAHGFQVLEEDSQLLYMHTEFHNKHAEGALRFNDPRVNVNWPLAPTDLSERDLNHLNLTENFKGIIL